MVDKRNTKSKTVSWPSTDMDNFSGLTDDLLVKILSFLPTRVAVSTSILSKRWECLWMWLPELKFASISDSEYERNSLRHFLDRNLPLHRAPVIESFKLDFSSPFANPKDIKLWLVIVLSRHVRKLVICYQPYCNKPDILPSSLFTCKSLVTLELGGNIRLDVPRRVCLPSLKTLQLLLDTFFDGVSLQRLLSICPVLEDLVAYVNYERDHVALLTVNVPSLQSLSLFISRYCAGLTDGLVIDTPSLKYFKLEDHGDFGHTYFIKNMPNLEDAYVNVKYPNVSSLIRSITSVKHLTICSGIVYDDDFVFNQLEHLELCLCTEVSSNLLLQLLKDSPNLLVLDIFIMNHNDFHNVLHWEDPPITVRECILSSFKTFNWSGYLARRPQGIGKILRFTSWENVGRLKTATISSESDTCFY